MAWELVSPRGSVGDCDRIRVVVKILLLVELASELFLTEC